MRAKKCGHRDKNHLSITNALQRAGYAVQDTSAVAGFVDAVASAGPARTVIIEIKSGDDGRLTADALETLAKWPGYAGIVATEEQALDLMRDPAKYGLTERYKGKLLLIAAQMRAKGQQTITWSAFQKAMEESK